MSFDLDGTLIMGGSADAHMARTLGFDKDILEWERKYVAGEITVRQFAEMDAGHYAGKRKADMCTILATARMIGGIKETVDKLHSRGICVLLGTVAWAFAAEYFRDKYGFDATSGTVMGEDASGAFNGVIEKHFDEHDKVKFVEAFCRERGIAMDEVAAVGDSRSDIPLFGKVGLAIALNAAPKAREAADVSLETDDLSAVLNHIIPSHG